MEEILKPILFGIILVLILSGCKMEKPEKVEKEEEHKLDIADVKVNMKTQVWYATPNDERFIPFSTPNGVRIKDYSHWSRNGNEPCEGNVGVEFLFLPEMYEANGAQLEELSEYRNLDGSPVKIFSSLDPAVIRTDLRNMVAAGIGTVSVQIFLTGTINNMERNYALIRMYLKYANEYKLKFRVEIDITGVIESELTERLKEFWIELNRRIDIHESFWEKINGKPSLAIWGLGFINRPGTVWEAIDIIKWFKTGEKNPVKVYLEGGVPFYWHTGSGDSKSNFIHAFVLFDCVSPWSIGRFDYENFDSVKFTIKEHIEVCRKHNISYRPVLWPGFSWHNLMSRKSAVTWLAIDNTQPYLIPRLKGEFLWKQFRFYKELGLSDLSYAMWNEDDEGTAFFSHQVDPHKLPSGMLIPDKGATSPDFYIRLITEINRKYLLEDYKTLPETVPIPLK